MAGSIEFPRGPQGQKCSADAIRFAEILTGEVKEDTGVSGKDKGHSIDGAEKRCGPAG
ncbi:MAG: hypothetical protein WCC90_16560 [Methylocella sp.]